VLALAFLLAAGCPDTWRRTGWSLSPEPRAASEVRQADNAFTPARSGTALTADTAPPAQIDVLLRVLHVQVPTAQRAKAQAVWEQLREDLCDNETMQRLHRNGVRVGLGRTEHWEAIRAALDGIEGNRVHELPPLRTPPAVPLALELDLKPQDQTIFYIDRDGIISGDTWLGGQRVLRVTYGLDLRDLTRIVLSVVPEIRRRSEPGLDYTDAGWTTGPRRAGKAFGAAGLAIELGTNEFLLVAPGDKADVFGLVGGAFLKQSVDGEAYDSYVFVRADVKYDHERH